MRQRQFPILKSISMIEPNTTYYYVNSLDIWEFERDLFFSDKGSVERIEHVENKTIDLIIRCRDRQIKDGNGLNIESITDLKKLDSGVHSSGYYDRYVRNWRSASGDIKERIAISIFPLQDAFYNLDQNIAIDPEEETFDYWFALKLSQYDCALKHLEAFLGFQLEQNFNSDVQDFEKFLKTIVLQYEVDYLSPRLVLLINNWLAEYQQKVEKETAVNISLSSKAPGTNSKNESQIHKTFLLEIVNHQPSIINNMENTSTLELMEGFTLLRNNNLLFGDVKWNEFKLIFQKEGLTDKIKWEGSLVELRELIKQICKPGLCSHLEKGLEKWKVAQECFLIKEKKVWVEISLYTRISNANGSQKRLKIIQDFGDKLSLMKLKHSDGV